MKGQDKKQIRERDHENCKAGRLNFGMQGYIGMDM